jgi:hypothetical protein
MPMASATVGSMRRWPITLRPPERSVGEAEARVVSPDDRQPRVVSDGAEAARTVDDIQADQFAEADDPATCRGVRPREPYIGLEVPQAHHLQRSWYVFAWAGCEYWSRDTIWAAAVDRPDLVGSGRADAEGRSLNAIACGWSRSRPLTAGPRRVAIVK